MTLYLKGYQNYNRLKLKSLNLQLVAVLMPFEIKRHTVPHLKALRCGIDHIKGQSCGSTFIIYQPFLKSVYLLHKKGFVDSQMVATVCFEYKFLGHSCYFGVTQVIIGQYSKSL